MEIELREKNKGIGGSLLKIFLLLFGWEAALLLFLLIAVGLIFGPLFLMGGLGDIGFEWSKNTGNWPDGVEWQPLEGIPAHLMTHFKAAEEQYGISWSVLASIAFTESSFRPGVIGPPNYTGELARGMMQFLPSTWKTYGIDGDGDGKADILNPIDSIYSAANYLAANKGASNIKDALFLYNHSNEYVNKILAIAEGYRVQDVWKNKGSGFPLPTTSPRYTGKFGDPRDGRSHAGVDIACDYGTPLLAVVEGTIRHSTSHAGGFELWIDGQDGVSYFYCHLSQYVAQSGQRVSVGQTVGRAGSTGVSSGPHLHFGIMIKGKWIDPMPFLKKLIR